MSRFIVLLLGFWSATAALASPATVLLLGDSLSAAYGIPLEQSWPEGLRTRLAACEPPLRLVNASISGETSAGGRSRFADLDAEHAPAILLLELGGNDGLRGLPLAQLEANLRAMIEPVVERGGRVLLFEMRIPTNYGPRYTEAFTAVYAALAAEYPGVTVLPFFLADIALDPAMFLDDGIHPSVAAQPVLLSAVWSALRPLLESSGAATTSALARCTTD